MSPEIEALQIELEIIAARGRWHRRGRPEEGGRRQAGRGEGRRAELEERWRAERELVDRILAIRARCGRRVKCAVAAAAGSVEAENFQGNSAARRALR